MRTAGVATAAAGVANTDGVAGVCRPPPRSALCVRAGRSALPDRCMTLPVECALPHRRNRLFVLALLPLLLSTPPPSPCISFK